MSRILFPRESREGREDYEVEVSKRASVRFKLSQNKAMDLTETRRVMTSSAMRTIFPLRHLRARRATFPIWN